MESLLGTVLPNLTCGLCVGCLPNRLAPHYYPADFMASVLSADMQTTDKVVINLEECKKMGVPISLDVNRGEFRFVADTQPTFMVWEPSRASVKGR